MITNIACIALLAFNAVFAFSLGAYSQVMTEIAMESKVYMGLPLAALSYVEVEI